MNMDEVRLEGENADESREQEILCRTSYAALSFSNNGLQTIIYLAVASVSVARHG